MFVVIRSYQELTGFQPVKLTDVCSAAVVLSVNSTSQGSLTSASKARITSVNS